MAGLCDVDASTPSDDTIESTWPGYLRALEQKVIDSVTQEHTCAGKHFYGVDTYSVTHANQYVVEVGTAAMLLSTGLYAGVFIKFRAGSKNTGACTLQVLSNGSGVGSTIAIKFVGADPLADTIKANQIVEVVYDGTNFQLIGGVDIVTIITNNPAITAIYKDKAADETISSSTTLQDDNDLFFPMVVSGKYKFELELFVSTPTGADLKIAINGPAGVTNLLAYVMDGRLTNAANVNTETQNAISAIATAVDVTLGVTSYWLRIAGIIENGVNAGNFTFQWAQRVSNGGSTSILKGSSLYARKI